MEYDLCAAIRQLSSNAALCATSGNPSILRDTSAQTLGKIGAFEVSFKVNP